MSPSEPNAKLMIAVTGLWGVFFPATVIITVVFSRAFVPAGGSCASTVPADAVVALPSATLTTQPSFVSAVCAAPLVIPTTLGTVTSFGPVWTVHVFGMESERNRPAPLFGQYPVASRPV